MARARFLSAAIGIAASVAAPASADVGEPVRITYAAPSTCPSEKAFLAEIAARTPRLRLAASGEQARSFAITVEADGPSSRGHVVIREIDEREAVREVSGAACGEVVSALALITAVAIDPDARTEPAAVVVPPTSPAPAPAPTPARIVAHGPDVAPPPPRVRRPPPRWQLGGGAEFIVATMVAPDVAPGVDGFVEVRRTPPRWLPLTVRLSGVYAWSAPAKTSVGTASFTWIAGRLEGCPLTWPRPEGDRPAQVGISPCLSIDAGALRGEGTNTIDARSETRAWLAPGLLARLEAAFFDRVVFEAQGGATVPLPSYHFYFGPSTPVFDVPRVGAVFGAGVGVRLP